MRNTLSANRLWRFLNRFVLFTDPDLGAVTGQANPLHDFPEYLCLLKALVRATYRTPFFSPRTQTMFETLRSVRDPWDGELLPDVVTVKKMM
jgi:hypothetical protein